jgi:hypothetical protein
MSHRKSAVLAALLAAALAGGTRLEAGPSAASGDETRIFLMKVGQIRARTNADNRDRIPGLIRGQDEAELAAEAARMEEDAHSLGAIPPAEVDAEAVAFTRNFVAILQAYRAVCLDTAEMFREIRTETARQSDPDRRPLALKFDPATYQRDTLGTLNSLLDSLSRARAADADRLMFLAASMEMVRRDRDDLRSAKQAHHDFTVKMKADFVQRYPSLDWNSKDVLP